MLCKFNDDDSDPVAWHSVLGRNFYEDLFTKSGIGKHNMVDFFHAVSHGAVDLTESQVFPNQGTRCLRPEVITPAAAQMRLGEMNYLPGRVPRRD